VAWFSFDWISALIMAYLIGAIPSAYVAGRLIKGKDIREEGDRNPGAGNAYRTIGPKAGVAVGAVDIGKGAGAVLLAAELTGSTSAGMAAGVVAMVGHNWPIFLKFRGGRGAASALGVFIALVPMPAIPISLVSLALLPIVKSATIVIGLIMISTPFVALLIGAPDSMVAYCVGLPVMVGVRHYITSRNLQRLEDARAGDQALPQG
jgi:glycerol-3-phosphate acyltransferase PlsY